MTIDKLTVRDSVNKAFADLKTNQEFSGYEFKRMCVSYAPNLRFKYVDTFLRLLRATHREEFICISRAESKYRKIG